MRIELQNMAGPALEFLLGVAEQESASYPVLAWLADHLRRERDRRTHGGAPVSLDLGSLPPIQLSACVTVCAVISARLRQHCARASSPAAFQTLFECAALVSGVGAAALAAANSRAARAGGN